MVVKKNEFLPLFGIVALQASKHFFTEFGSQLDNRLIWSEHLGSIHILNRDAFFCKQNWRMRLEGGWKKSTQAQNLAISKWFTILIQFADILATKPNHEIIIFTKFQKDRRKICVFFTNSQVLCLCTFFLSTLYLYSRYLLWSIKYMFIFFLGSFQYALSY